MRHSNKEQGMLTRLLYRFKILSIVLVKLKSYAGMKKSTKAIDFMQHTAQHYQSLLTLLSTMTVCSFLP